MPAMNITETFFTHHNSQINRVKDDRIDFAHYTTADTAYKIINNQQLWMRNLSVMNDYKEFEHGKDILKNLIDESAEGAELKRISNSFHPGIFDKIYKNLQDWSFVIKDDHYISCFSEHPQKDDDNHGKLSMWRAYGGNTGVAIVFKSELIFESALDSFLDFSSVAYLTSEKLRAEISTLNQSILTNDKFVKNLGSAEFEKILFNVFKFASLCNKHSGFFEEKEWKLIVSNHICKDSNFILQEIETINGVPQKILKLKFDELDNEKLLLKNLIKKIIIGPCEYPWVIYQTLKLALEHIGIKDASKLIHFSGIPLRAQRG